MSSVGWAASDISQMPRHIITNVTVAVAAGAAAAAAAAALWT